MKGRQDGGGKLEQQIRFIRVCMGYFEPALHNVMVQMTFISSVNSDSILLSEYLNRSLLASFIVVVVIVVCVCHDCTECNPS